MRSTPVDNGRLLEAVIKYNETAPADLKAVGTSQNYRQKTRELAARLSDHYEFYERNRILAQNFTSRSDFGSPLSELLSPLSSKIIGSGNQPLIWDNAWSNGRGRLAVRFSYEDDPTSRRGGP